MATEISDSSKPVRRDSDIYKSRTLVASDTYISNLFTVLFDPKTSQREFIFSTDAIVSHLFEECVGLLPFIDSKVKTPTSSIYEGVSLPYKVCCISMYPDGEFMEHGVKMCDDCLDIGRVILKENEKDTRISYARFPTDISTRCAILMIPFLDEIDNVRKAISFLQSQEIKMDFTVILGLFGTKNSVEEVVSIHPKLQLVVGEVLDVIPREIFSKYYECNSN